MEQPRARRASIRLAGQGDVGSAGSNKWRSTALWAPATRVAQGCGPETQRCSCLVSPVVFLCLEAHLCLPVALAFRILTA